MAKIDSLKPDRRNANKGTERGRAALESSLQKYGAGRSILLDKHGNIIAGNKTAKVATDYARDVMFRIIDYRTSRNLPIFVTTNLSPAELSDQFHDRTARRLLSACAVINMQGKTLR